MNIDLNCEQMSLTVESFGAYVESFEYKKSPVFFPKTLFEINGKKKHRGGMHPCCPNFGVDEITGLPNHGFLRDMEFEIVNRDKSSLKLKLSGVENYKDVDFFIDYKLTNNKFITTLTVINNAKEEKLIAPAFHPYFYCENLDLEIKDFSFDRDKLQDTIFIDRDKINFSCNGHDFLIYGTNIHTFAIWTDFFSDYVCIEPTYNGTSFTKKDDNAHSLSLGEKFIQEVVIEIL